MAAMNMVSAGGFSGVSFNLSKCPQGVASVLCKKTPIFGSRGSKFDHLTVCAVASKRSPESTDYFRSHVDFGYFCQLTSIKISR
jgi:hypothetical protein